MQCGDPGPNEALVSASGAAPIREIRVLRSLRTLSWACEPPSLESQHDWFPGSAGVQVLDGAEPKEHGQ